MATPNNAPVQLSREQVRLLLFYEHRSGSSTRHAADRINNLMGADTVTHATAVRWFQKFRRGEVEFKDSPHSGRPQAVDEDELLALVKEDPRQSSRCLASKLGHSHSTINRALHDLGFSWKQPIWVPHVLSDFQRQMRANVAASLLSERRTKTWLSNLITGDEKWTLYVNYHRGRQWLKPGESGVPTPKQELHPKKVLLCIWWSVEGPVHWELLPTNTTVTADLYCKQLTRVAEKIKGKMDRVYFLHDNARPHVAKVTHQKIQELGWTTLAHPPYSPDMAPTDYHLFRSLTHFLDGKQFQNEDHLKTELQSFFDSKPREFYRKGIEQLPIRWQYIVDNNGAYYVD
uniref:HTH_48 domain-containing protein n=1 Tax=Caenorhabditis tropicalis TaxID=1561998 RepID=A0A1I7V3L7_9PELO